MVAPAACSAVSWGRSAVTAAPGPRLWNSAYRASRQDQVPKSVHGAAPMWAPMVESRITVCAMAFGSLLGCQGRPRKTVPAGASLVSLLLTIRKPYGLVMAVLAAVT